jgi:hypothetical protein
VTTTTQVLVDAATAVLLTPTSAGPPAVYPTDAAARVYAPRDWPTWDNQYPCIFVSGPREKKASLGRSTAPEFTVVSTVRIVARTQALGAIEDGGAGVVEAELWALQRQIEVAIINSPSLMPLLQQYPSVDSETGINSDGKQHLGELVMEVAMEYYQGPEDFYPVDGPELTQVNVTTNFPTQSGVNVGFEITLSE